MTEVTLKTSGSGPICAFYCGLDVHKHELAVAIFARDDSRIEHTKYEVFPTTLKGLNAFWGFIAPYHPKGFVMEATGVFHHRISQFLDSKRTETQQTFEIYIVNPADAAAIPGRQKCDRLDAEHLARYYAAGILKNGRPLIPVLEDLKAVFRMVAKLEHERTTIKNRIYKTLDRAGFRPQKLELNTEWLREFLFAWTSHSGTLDALLTQVLAPTSEWAEYHNRIRKALPEMTPFADLVLSPAQRALVRQDLYDLDLKTSRKSLLKLELEKVLNERWALRDMAYNLSTIPGISAFSALWILAELGGFRRFPAVRPFLAYCGCVPRTVSTAGKVYSAHISRHSNKYLREIFYQAGVVLCNLVKADSSLKTFARRMVILKHNYLKVAYCTVGAKIARTVFGVLKSNQPFVSELADPKNADRAQFCMVERKDIHKASRALKRIQAIAGLKDVEYDIKELLCSLETLVARKN